MGVVVAVSVLLFSGGDGDETPPDTPGVTGTSGVSSGETSTAPTDADTTTATEQSGVVLGTTGTAGTSGTTGGTPATTAPSGDGTTTTPPTGGNTGSSSVLDDGDLQIDAVVGYYGSFLEDGSDTVLSDVAAILVTNHSERMVQVAQITFQVNATEQAHFQITDIPAGETVLALEQNRRPYSAADDYSYGKTATAYMDTPSLEEDKFSIDTGTAGKLTLKNLTDETYGKVYVYYKYYQSGMYMGGITYRVPFENVPANGQVESIAGHFDPEVSRIMAVVVMPENAE